ncbi:MAG: MFS transporter, partial [Dehalococcoidia bacterium]
MLPAIQEDTGWSRSAITLAITCGSMGSGFMSPFFGRLADKYGPRFISVAALAIVSVLLVVIAT